jgi:hypothetical protein
MGAYQNPWKIEGLSNSPRDPIAQAEWIAQYNRRLNARPGDSIIPACIEPDRKSPKEPRSSVRGVSQSN